MTDPAAMSTFHPENWDASRSEYVIAEGDTLAGLAALYLGDESRYGEILALQTNTDGSYGPNGPYLNKDVSKWFPGSTAPGSSFRAGAVLLMPEEALAVALAAGAPQDTPPAPAQPAQPAPAPPIQWAPGYMSPGAVPPTAPTTLTSGQRIGLAIGLGVATALLFSVGPEL